MSAIPNLFIPGVAKSATSYLFSCLSKSPDIYTPQIKEMHYMASEWMSLPFSEDDPFKEYEKHIIHNRKSYEAYYADFNNERYLLDCSPTYLFYPESAIKIKELSPDAKIIIALRNPTDRAFSQYKMNVRINCEPLSFEEALLDEENRLSKSFFRASAYKTMGLYSHQIKLYIDSFEPEQLHYILYDDISMNPKSVISSICEWLDIEFKPDMVNNEKRNYTGYPRFSTLNGIIYGKRLRMLAKSIIKSPKMRERLNKTYINANNTDINMAPDTRAMLVDYYRTDIKKLEVLTGLSLNHWH